MPAPPADLAPDMDSGSPEIRRPVGRATQGPCGDPRTRLPGPGLGIEA